MSLGKKGLVFIAHGSRNPKSNQQIASLANTVAKTISQKYAMVDYAFLEFAEPSITDAVQRQINSGMQEITIFPYFLANGNHVMIDIPALIHGFTVSNPQILFSLLPVFGSYAGMADLIATLL